MAIEKSLSDIIRQEQKNPDFLDNPFFSDSNREQEIELPSGDLLEINENTEAFKEEKYHDSERNSSEGPQWHEEVGEVVDKSEVLSSNHLEDSISENNELNDSVKNETKELAEEEQTELASDIDNSDIKSYSTETKDNNTTESPTETYDDIKENNNETNELTEEEKLQKIKDFEEGKIDFEEVKEIYAEYYAKAVNSNKPWAWNQTIPGGSALTAGQRKQVITLAREKNLVPTVQTYEKDGKVYADFNEYKAYECVLDKDDWNKTDQEQFEKCNQMLLNEIENNPELAAKFTPEQLEQIRAGKTPSGYTWHHSEKDGTMQLVPFGVHNSTNHCGGRSEGNWADSPRQ